MGGAIRVVIREKDGSVWSNERWTNAMPGLTRDVRFVDDDDAWFVRYKANGEWHTDDHTLAPIEYGIVVIDRMTRTVIDSNGYGRTLSFGIVHFVNHYDDEDYLELIRRGLVTYKREPLSIPEGADIERFASDLWKQDRHGSLDIVCTPWTLIELAEGDYEGVRAKMVELGFEFTARDTAAFDAEISNRNREDDQDEIDIVALLEGMPRTEADLARDRASDTGVAKD